MVFEIVANFISSLNGIHLGLQIEFLLGKLLYTPGCGLVPIYLHM